MGVAIMENIKTIKRVNHSISYEVNPYTELFGVMSILVSNSKVYRQAGDERFNKNYRDDILKWFDPFKKHKVLSLLTEYTDRYQFNYDAPCAFFLELSDNINGFSDYIRKERLPIATNKTNEFVLEIESFIQDSNFNNFYLNNEKRYKNSINNFLNTTEKYSPEKYLFSFIGEKPKQFTVNLMHSVTNSNYGLVTEKNLYVCIAPNGSSYIDDEPNFAFELSDITSLILHELAHSFINPMTDKYDNLVKNINKKLFCEVFKYNPYGNNVKTAINETIIRSIECMYIRDFFPNEFDEFLNLYLLRGFSQIPKVMDLLEQFQKEREFYNTLDFFYPEILKSFL